MKNLIIKRPKFIFVLPLMLATGMSYSQSFSGLPNLKISESGLERIVEKIDGEKAEKAACEIKKIDGKYFWISRGGNELVKFESGAFNIYIDVTGAGYVKTIKTENKVIASAMSKTEQQFDYIEHVHIGIRTITYWGKKK